MTDEEMRVLELVARAVADGRMNIVEMYDLLNGHDVLSLIERVRKAERPSHPTAEHSQRVVTALEEMLAPLSDGTLGTRDVAGRVSALLERNKTLESFATGFVQAVDDATAHAENTGKGMQVPFHGDFAQAKQVPSILGRLKWWANAAREALGQKT